MHCFLDSEKFIAGIPLRGHSQTTLTVASSLNKKWPCCGEKGQRFMKLYIEGGWINIKILVNIIFSWPPVTLTIFNTLNRQRHAGNCNFFLRFRFRNRI